jgi:hypothetical protein
LVHQPFEVTQRPDCPLVVERQQLHHLHGGDVPLRVDPELGVEDAGPAETARAAQSAAAFARGRDLEAEPELVPAGAEWKWSGHERIGGRLL